MNLQAWHLVPVIASHVGGNLAAVLAAEALAGLCALVGIPCVMLKRHLAARVVMRVCGLVCLLAALLVFSAIASGNDWVFVTMPVVLGILMLVLARPKARPPGRL